jgi:large subunit ribosomal protein L4
VFGPKPHPYHHDVPRKMRRLAIRSALSDKVANEQLIVVNNLTLETPRTKDMLALLGKLPVKGRRVLMMLPKRDENILLSVRNIPTAKAQHVSSINVVELLKHDSVIMPKQTVRWIELVFGEGLSAEEASHRIAEEFDEQEVAREDTEQFEESPETDESHEAETELSSEDGEDEQAPQEADFEALEATDDENGTNPAQ